jgi:putative hemolysin
VHADVAARAFDPGHPAALPSLQANQSVAAALEQLIREHHHIALVKNQASEVVGMVTLEDIIEELLGEIHDEFDRLPSQITRSGSAWIAGGGSTLSQIEKVTGIVLPRKDESTQPLSLNEWLTRHLGRPPDPGEELRVDGIRVLVRKERRQAVQEAQLSRDTRETAKA